MSTMSPKTIEAVRRALEGELGRAADNLYRARAAFSGADLTKQHGESGRTRGEILAEYETAAREARAALAEFSKEA